MSEVRCVPEYESEVRCIPEQEHIDTYKQTTEEGKHVYQHEHEHQHVSVGA